MAGYQTNVETKEDTSTTASDIDQVFDSEWVKSTFIIADPDIVTANNDGYKKWLRANRYFSTADFKFTSSSPGMSMAVNPKPQFTRYADIRSKGRLKRQTVTIGTTTDPKSLGMGRYYSEAIDDNEQRIFLRFGVPTYTPLTVWLSKSFDIDKAIFQNRGIITSAMLEAIGMVSNFFAIVSAPLLWAGMMLANVMVDNSRMYYLKDTMYSYWGTVDNILNTMVARRTMLPTVFRNYSYDLDNKVGSEQKVNESFLSVLNNYLPDVIDPQTGRISVYAIALRAQTAYNKMLHDDYNNNKDKPLSEDYTGYQYKGEPSHDTYFTNRKGEARFYVKYLFEKAYNTLIARDDKIDQAVSDSANGQANESLLTGYDPVYLDSSGNPISLKPDPNNPKNTINQQIQDNARNNKSTMDSYREYVLSEITEGGLFAVFNVESTGSVGESFSNSIGDNPLENIFNSMSSTVRQAAPFLNEAKSIPIVGDILRFALDAGAKVLSSASYGLANPLLALLYGVNASLPKVWTDSSASFPRSSYRIKLISPYGNPYSQLFNIYLPLAMILAGSLPRSTGSSTYTSPFLCQLYDRGRSNIELGVIESVNITRGTSNLAFTRSGHPNAIDVDMTIASLDEIISVDINPGNILTNAISQLSTGSVSNPFSSYMNTITGVDVYTQVYSVPKLRLVLAERYMKFRSAFIDPDPAGYAMFSVNAIPLVGDAAKAIFGNNAALVQDIFNR